MNLGSLIGDIGLSTIRKITDLWAGAKSDSLIDYTQVARVEPIVLIDTDCLYLDALPEVQQSLLSIFAGYYLQAVAISTSVGKIEVMRHLDKLNPRRNPGDSAANSMGWLLAQESYRHGLPFIDKMVALEANHDYASMTDVERDAMKIAISEDSYLLNKDKLTNDKEQWGKTYAETLIKNGFDRSEALKQSKLAADKFQHDKEKYGEEKALANLKFDLEKQGLDLRKQEREDRLTASEIGFGRDTMKDLKELANLSVGKMFSVEITDGLHKASIMVAIRLMASSLPTSSLIHILSIGSQDNTVKERYHAWKAGRLEFIKDLCFCQDLIDAHRKNLMADKDGIYSNLIKRARGNQISTLVSGNPSVATASNLVIMSNTTAEQLEIQLNGKLSNFKTREKMMKDTYLMIFCIVDKEWDRVTFYHRGISQPTEVGLRDLKSANKGSGPDVSDILSAYRVGNNPSI